MRTKSRILLFAASFLAAIGLLVWFVEFVRRPPEPVYQGRTVTFWLENAHDHSASLADQKAAGDAIHQAGTNAIPTLLRLMRARDSTAKTKILKWFQRHPRFKAPFVSANNKNMEAYLGFLALDRDTRFAVPELIQIYETAPESTAARIIPDIFRSLGPDANPAVPALIHAAVNSTNHNARAEAVLALGTIRSRPEIVVPALINSLRDTDYYTRANAAQALANFGADARPALPALTNLLGDPDALVRMTTTNTLIRLRAVGPAPATPPVIK